MKHAQYGELVDVGSLHHISFKEAKLAAMDILFSSWLKVVLDNDLDPEKYVVQFKVDELFGQVGYVSTHIEDMPELLTNQSETKEESGKE